MGVPSGGNVGNAQGRITIDTSDFERARVAAQQFAQSLNQMFSQVNASSNRAQAGISGLSGTLRSAAGAFGLSLGVAGAVQLGRMAIEATETATAFRRQEIAARSLAGSQHQLNELLEAYARATGGAIDQAQAMTNVTRLQAIGFGDSAEELERFVAAARGISLATGQSQDYVIQQLQLAIANQSTMRLDQLGLGVSEVKQRVAELRAENKGLTQEMAYQQAILGLAEEKFGALAKGAGGQKTGLENLGTAWNNFGLKIAQIIEGPVGAVANFFAKGFQGQIKALEEWQVALDGIEKTLIRIGLLNPSAPEFVPTRAPNMRRLAPPDAELMESRRQVKLDWARGITELNDRMYEEISNAESDYGRQRADLVRSYNTSLLREARDFGVARQRAEEDHLEAIADLHADAARRETRMAEDLARSIADAQADTTERIADAREETNDRLVELEEDYAKDRERAEKDHRDKLMSAAGRLDAVALLEERKHWARESQDAKEAHDDRRNDLKKQLDKRIADEEEALDKSIRHQQEAYERQLEDARENDRLRLDDMQADFEERKRREDEDRARRLADLAQDYQDQLAEMDTAHGERIQQIKKHAQEERDQLDEEAKTALLKLGVHNEAWRKAQEDKEEWLEKLWDKFMGHAGKSLSERVDGPVQGPQPRPGWPSLANPPSFALGGYVQRGGWARVHAGEFVMPSPATAAAASARSISVGNISLSVMGTTNMGESQFYAVARRALIDALEEVAGN